jgi:hypothetical protein
VRRETVQQLANGQLQRLYLRGEIVLRAHTIVRVRVYSNSYLYHQNFTVIMAQQRKSSDTASASKPKRSCDVLSISEKVKTLDMIQIKKVCGDCHNV